MGLKKRRNTRRRVYERDGHACAYCRSTVRLTLDHLVPESRGGMAYVGNLVTACYECNTKRGHGTAPEVHPDAPPATHQLVAEYRRWEWASLNMPREGRIRMKKGKAVPWEGGWTPLAPAPTGA